MQAAFLTRAAELSDDARRRAMRYLAAAEAYLAAGDGPLAEAILDLATPGLDDAGMHVSVQRMRASIAVFFSRHKDAPAILLDAARVVDANDLPLLRDHDDIERDPERAQSPPRRATGGSQHAHRSVSPRRFQIR